MAYPINYFKEDVSIDLRKLSPFKKWLIRVSEHHQHKIEALNYILCSDEYLLQINQDYLNHDTYTDIITFDNRDDMDQPIEGDIFISFERVKENAVINKVTVDIELARVMAHGLLHLIGFKDKTDKEKQTMREQEDNALNFLLESNVSRGTL
jgi:rRNA maturation RNase YbeY